MDETGTSVWEQGQRMADVEVHTNERRAMSDVTVSLPQRQKRGKGVLMNPDFGERRVEEVAATEDTLHTIESREAPCPVWERRYEH